MKSYDEARVTVMYDPEWKEDETRKSSLGLDYMMDLERRCRYASYIHVWYGYIYPVLCQQYYVLPIVMSIDIFLFCETTEGRIAYHWKK